MPAGTTTLPAPAMSQQAPSKSCGMPECHEAVPLVPVPRRGHQPAGKCQKIRCYDSGGLATWGLHSKQATGVGEGPQRRRQALGKPRW